MKPQGLSQTWRVSDAELVKVRIAGRGQTAQCVQKGPRAGVQSWGGRAMHDGAAGRAGSACLTGTVTDVGLHLKVIGWS